MYSSLPLERSLGHEVFHALLRSGHFSNEQWWDILRPAGETWAGRFGTADIYERHTPERLAEEACARAFGEALQARTLRSPGAVPALAPGEGRLAPSGLAPRTFAAEDIPAREDFDPENRSSTVKPSTPSGEPDASATPTSTSSTRPGRRGPARKAHRVQRIVLTKPIPPHMRKHVDELVRSVIDNLYLAPPMPPRYRERYEKNEKD